MKCAQAAAPSEGVPTAVNQETMIQLLMANRAMLMGYIWLIVGDPHVSEDVFQEVAVVVLAKGAELDDIEGFKPWVRKIARFKALKALRLRDRAPQVLDEALLDLLDQDWRASDSRESLADALRSCVGKLTPQARRLVELRFGHNLTGQVLADKLDRQLNAVYVALARIYRALASCVKIRMSQEGAADA